MKPQPSALRFINRKLRFLSPQKRLELFPPFWFMGVKVKHLSDDWRHARIRLPLTWRARNMGGSMFGGYQAALADPIAAIACARVFPGHDVWTRHLQLDFHRPGTTDLELRFDFPAETEETIRQELAKKHRSNPVFTYGFYTADGKQCTQITCKVAVRKEGYAARFGVGSAS
ncbi:MAG: PaaI family thioesterase [bacterium]